jgi:hypothetical protein
LHGSEWNVTCIPDLILSPTFPPWRGFSIISIVAACFATRYRALIFRTRKSQRPRSITSATVAVLARLGNGNCSEDRAEIIRGHVVGQVRCLGGRLMTMALSC